MKTFKIDHQRGRFIFLVDYEHKDFAKSSGFSWDRDLKVWWSTSSDCVERALNIPGITVKLSDSAQAALEKAKESRELSRAAALDNPSIKIPAPDGLNYLPYQKAGIAYAMGRTSTLIADEMGLGKTVQAIGVINADQSIKSALVIVPASLKYNWRREAEKWLARDLTVGIADGKNFPDTNIVICNFEQVKKFNTEIKSRTWDALIVDEAHYLKNSKAERTKLILGDQEHAPIKAGRKIFLTGTPILNRPIELWPLVHAIDPNGLGRSWKYFAMRYCDAQQTRWGWDTSGASNLPELQQRMRESFMVRRLKADVLQELPDKRRNVFVIEPDGKVRDLLKQESEIAQAMDDAAAATAKEIARAEIEGDMETFQKGIHALKDGLKPQFDQMSKVRHALAMAKVEPVISWIRDQEPEKLVVMCHHKEVAEAIAKEFGPESVCVTGETSIANRDAAVQKFQNTKDVKLFVGTIGAAGVGLTLTAASDVAFAEMDWTPGKVLQAEDRVHRIGQKNAVNVTYLVFDGTLESHIAKTMAHKIDVISQGLDKEGEIDLSAIPIQQGQQQRGSTAIQLLSRFSAAGNDEKIAQRKAENERIAARITSEQIQVVHSAIKSIAEADRDRALAKNDRGFSKADSEFGHELASAETLTPRQAAVAARLAYRYRAQLDADTVEKIKEVLDFGKEQSQAVEKPRGKQKAAEVEMDF
jgi:SWI/SNF-related matrix-associated actin-dependent regulator 1 of chromatin subfamily A